MNKLLFIDSQSYDNLAVYDYSLLKGIDAEIIYCCNTMYNAPILENVVYKRVFCYSNANNSFRKVISYIVSLLKIFLIARNERPDVVHIQWWRLWVVDYIFLFLLKYYVKQIVFTAHNVVPHNSGNKMKFKCMQYYKKVDKIIVHTNNTKQELVLDFGILPQKIYVIPHGLLRFNLDRNKVDCMKNNLSEIYNLQGRLIFGALGVQSPYKGTDLIQSAFINSALLKNNSDVFLIVGGKGNIINADTMNGCSNVYINNSLLSDEEFQALMELTDVLLLPYRRISQSGVLLTAIEAHIPYIATEKGGLLEPLSIANVGWRLCEVGADELRVKMEELFLKKESVIEKKNAQTEWDKVKAYYNWNRIGTLTMECYGFKHE